MTFTEFMDDYLERESPYWVIGDVVDFLDGDIYWLQKHAKREDIKRLIDLAEKLKGG